MPLPISPAFKETTGSGLRNRGDAKQGTWGSEKGIVGTPHMIHVKSADIVAFDGQFLQRLISAALIRHDKE